MSPEKGEKLHECLGCGLMLDEIGLWQHDKKHYYEVLAEYGITPYGIAERRDMPSRRDYDDSHNES